MPETKTSRVCVVCGKDISDKQKTARTCSKRCQQKARREENKEQYLADARKYMRERRNTEEGKNKDIEIRRKYRKTEKFKAYKRFEQQRRLGVKHDAHVKCYRRWIYKIKICNSHVVAFNRFKKTANNGWHARYWKMVGKPWKNTRLSDSIKYVIQYRLDLEFRLKEINRQTWRKEILKERDDGTINFWVLLRERKTCPYCGCVITKESAVADHMDPIKLGGANSHHNLTICCRSCNRRKAGRAFIEWIEMLPVDRQGAALRWYKRKHGHGPEQQSLTFEFAA